MRTPPEVAAFKAELQAVIDRHLDAVLDADWDDADLSPLERAEMGAVYVSGWVLAVAVSSFEDASGDAVSARFAPPGQSYFTTLGLITDQANDMAAG